MNAKWAHASVPNAFSQSFLWCSCSFTLDLKTAAHVLALFSLLKRGGGRRSDFSCWVYRLDSSLFILLPFAELAGRIQAGEGKQVLIFLSNDSSVVCVVLSSKALLFSKWITVTINNLHKFQKALFALLNLLNDLDSNIKNFSQRWERLFIPKLGEQFWWYSNRASFAYRKECSSSVSMMEKKLQVISAVVLVAVVSFSWFCFNHCDLAAAAAMLLGLRNVALAVFFLYAVKTVTHWLVMIF